MSFVRYWRAELGQNWFLALPLIACVVSIGFNAWTGWIIAGLPLAAVLFAIAIFTTYAGTVGPRGRGPQAAWLLAFLPFGLLIDQVAVWQTLGISIADGQVVRTRAASAGGTAADRLAALRAERAGIETPRAIAAIEAARDLECARTSRRYPNGNGPKCTEFKIELGKAQRVKRLDEQLIPEALAALDDAPATSEGQPQYAIPMIFVQAALDAGYGRNAPIVTAAQIDIGVQVLLALAISFLANIGFWAVGYDPVRGRGSRGDDDDWDDAAQAWETATPPLARSRSTGRRIRSAAHYEDGQPLAVLPVSRRLDGPPPREALGFDPHSTAHISGAPIHINVGSPYGMPPANGDVPPVRAETVADVVAGYQQPPSAPTTSSRASVATAPDAPPVDRSKVADDVSDAEREAADLIASFAAACVVPSTGGIISAGDVYARYERWAADRALRAEAFWNLFARVSGWRRETIGGQPHLRGVALRVAPALDVVAS